MERKLFDSERKVMEILWQQGDMTAGNLAKILQQQIGWNRNTTYTVIKKCVEKGVIERQEPNFLCKAVLTQRQAQQQETSRLIDRMFGGSAEQFFAAFLSDRNLTPEQLNRLRQMIDESEER